MIKIKLIFVAFLFLFNYVAFAQQGLVGINTETPQRTLDIEGNLRIGVTEPTDDNLSTESRHLLINPSTGFVYNAPSAFGKTVGGYRPGRNIVIGTVNPTNTLARIRFVVYITNSNPSNNNVKECYFYGDCMISGRTSDPVLIRELTVKGFDGQDLTLASGGIGFTEFAVNTNSQGNVIFSIDQVTGQIRVMSGTNVFTIVFEMMGVS